MRIRKSKNGGTHTGGSSPSVSRSGKPISSVREALDAANTHAGAGRMDAALFNATAAVMYAVQDMHQEVASLRKDIANLPIKVDDDD